MRGAILVSMTRINRRPKSAKATPSAAKPGHWRLQDAKARFSELVRKVRSEGPQHVTVHGLDAVVIMAAEDFRRLHGDRTGRALIEAIQSSPRRDVDLTAARAPMPVRGVAF